LVIGMALEEFGPFASAFAPVGDSTSYLALLDLRGAEVQVVLDRIEQALSTEAPQPWVYRLLADPDWRPHLVGALAMLLDEGARLEPMALWQAIDAGSWVTPQLVVTASFVDGAFVERACARIRASCPVSIPEGLSASERHVATGPASALERSAKLLASLSCASSFVPALSTWLEETAAGPSIQDLLDQDVDDSPLLVKGWRDHLALQFAQRGRVLKPPAARSSGRIEAKR